ncbi:hypothetical protein MC885_018226 [Smutsia gigantea]|nr:hypothetical protein MC885_018226 [Smutsia gigantea]
MGPRVALGRPLGPGWPKPQSQAARPPALREGSRGPAAALRVGDTEGGDAPRRSACANEGTDPARQQSSAKRLGPQPVAAPVPAGLSCEAPPPPTRKWLRRRAGPRAAAARRLPGVRGRGPRS